MLFPGDSMFTASTSGIQHLAVERDDDTASMRSYNSAVSVDTQEDLDDNTETISGTSWWEQQVV